MHACVRTRFKRRLAVEEVNAVLARRKRSGAFDIGVKREEFGLSPLPSDGNDSPDILAGGRGEGTNLYRVASCGPLSRSAGGEHAMRIYARILFLLYEGKFIRAFTGILRKDASERGEFPEVARRYPRYAAILSRVSLRAIGIRDCENVGDTPRRFRVPWKRVRSGRERRKKKSRGRKERRMGGQRERREGK